VSKIVSVKFHKANETVNAGEAKPLVPIATPVTTSTTNRSVEASQVTATGHTEVTSPEPAPQSDSEQSSATPPAALAPTSVE
jgi:hypothetical protein